MQILSGNLVGYQSIQPRAMYEGGSKITGGGSAFLSVGGVGYCLNDFKIVDGNEEADTIAFVQTGSAKIDNAKKYYWYEGEGTVEDPSCWCYATSGDPVDPEEAAMTIPAGTGFLCTFGTSKAKIVYAGEVNKGVKGEIECGRAGKYTYVCNPCPYDVPLKDIYIKNGNEEADAIKFMQKASAKVDNARSYYWYEGDGTAEDPACWYDAATGEPSEKALTEVIKAGEAVLFVSGTSKARVVFKAPAL